MQLQKIHCMLQRYTLYSVIYIVYTQIALGSSVETIVS